MNLPARLTRAVNAAVEFVACLCLLWPQGGWWSARKAPSGQPVKFGTNPPAPVGLAEPR